MNKKKILALVALLLVSVLMLASCGAGKFTMGTGGTGGTYYAFGAVLSQYIENNANVSCVAVSTDGSKANIQGIDAGDYQLGTVQSDVMSYAYNGERLFDTVIDGFSVVAALYMEQVQIVTCDPTIKTVADLAGKRVSIGAAGSGVYFNAIDVLGCYGLTEADIIPTYQGFGDSANALKDNQIDAAFVVSGAPTTAIVELATTKTAYLVSIEDANVDKLLKTSPYYAKSIIKAGTYNGQTSDVTTVAVGAVILARNDIPENAIYALVSDIFATAADSSAAAAHAKYGELSLDFGASITSVPYHPGAAKYYKEQGITIPDYLK